MSALKITPADKENSRDIELRSEDIREILGQIPRWIVRYGTLLIVMVVFILFLGAVYLKYPDVIIARVKLTTETPPAELTANVSGQIKTILVTDKSQVRENQVLVILESASDYNDILSIQAQLGDTFDHDSLILLNLPGNLKLGSIQDTYSELVKKLQEYKDFIKLNYHSRKINSIETEMRKYQLYFSSLKEQENVQFREYSLEAKQFSRDSMLFQQNVLSSVQLEKSESSKLTKLFAWTETKTQLASAQIEIINLQQEILELELKLEENSRLFIQQLREAFEKLNGQIGLWERQYVIRSPFDGQVTFTKIWTANQYIEQGDIVVTVIPGDRGKIVGITVLSSKGAGKVKVGHRVMIQFDNYPFMEYGTVSGSISSLSLVPNNEQYMAEIRLDSTVLITNYHLVLDFHQNMPGQAQIVTDERNLMSRILAPFRYAFEKQRSLN
jgi:HlyD family secretion protein